MIRWVFGGTAVGKKTWIRRRLRRCRKFKTVWMYDGPITENDQAILESGIPLLVRWQWGRERKIVELLRDRPDLIQSIVLISASIETQLKRVAKREGEQKWSEENLVGEAKRIRKLVSRLGERFGMPIEEITT